MSDFAVEGDDLKKMLKIAKRQPIPFAYCPGPSTENDLFALHRKKPGAVMAKALRAEGEGNKIAFGALSVEGKTVTLRCERVLPAIAKKLKKFLKLNKVMRNVRVLDENGNVLEEDIEDLPDAPDDDDADDAFEAAPDDDDGEAPDAAGADAGTGDPAATAAAFDTAALVARIKAVQPRIAGLGGETGERLKKAIVEAAGALKAGDAARSAALLDRIEAILATLPDPAAPSSAPPPEGATARDRLQQAAAKLAQRIKSLPEGEMRAMLAGQVRDLVGAIREGAVERAISGLKALQTDLDLAERNLADDAAAAPEAATETAPETGTQAPGDPLAIWNAAKEQTDSAIGRLQERLRQEGNAELERIADYGLNGLTEGNQVALMKRLLEYRAAPPAGRPVAAGKLVEQAAEYRKFLAASELIALCERNPFVSVDIRGPLDAALREIENAVR